MKRFATVALVAGGILAGTVSTASAATYQITATGYLSDTSAAFPSILQNDDPFTFIFFFDTASSDLDPSNDTYYAQGGNNWSAEVGSYTASGIGNSTVFFTAGYVNFSGFSDYMSDAAATPISGETTASDFEDGGTSNLGATFRSISFSVILDYPTADPLSVLLALSSGAFSPHLVEQFLITGRELDNLSNAFRYQGVLTGVEVSTVPLPAGVWLLLSALSGLGLLGWRGYAAACMIPNITEEFAQ